MPNEVPWRSPRHRRGSVALLHLLAASTWLYGALLVLYPKAFRRRYGAEMRRDFRALVREGFEEGGASELVRVLVQALPDLVLTALKERITMPAGAASVMVAVALVAVVVTMASLLLELTHEASSEVWVDLEYGGLAYALWERDV